MVIDVNKVAQINFFSAKIASKFLLRRDVNANYDVVLK